MPWTPDIPPSLPGPVPENRRIPQGDLWLELEGACENNLNAIDVLGDLTRETVRIIHDHNVEEPLFLYYPLPSLILLFSTAMMQLAFLVYRASIFSSLKGKMLFVVTGFLRSWVYISSFVSGLLYGFILRIKEKIVVSTNPEK